MEFDRFSGRKEGIRSVQQVDTSPQYHYLGDGLNFDFSEASSYVSETPMEANALYSVAIKKIENAVSSASSFIKDRPLLTGAVVGGIILGAQVIQERMSQRDLASQDPLEVELQTIQ
jgi:hypothetical protein